MMPSLETFLKECEGTLFPRSLYVETPGFNSCYVRVGPDYVEGACVERCFTFAYIVASDPGSGAFTRLAHRIHTEGFTILVECVTSARFAEHLRRAGYQQVASRGGHPTFYWR